jgi:transposase
MKIQIQRGCGLDVHQATVVACLLIVLANGKVKKHIGKFGTTSHELMALREWLQAKGCTHVAMESTGVYWKPVYAILEGDFELTVANAQRIKNVPGRKTDVKDAEWIADLLLHGRTDRGDRHLEQEGQARRGDAGRGLPHAHLDIAERDCLQPGNPVAAGAAEENRPQ